MNPAAFALLTMVLLWSMIEPALGLIISATKHSKNMQGPKVDPILQINSVSRYTQTNTKEDKNVQYDIR
jgi:hypothetical protein